jgi:hypothetical protein
MIENPRQIKDQKYKHLLSNEEAKYVPNNFLLLITNEYDKCSGVAYFWLIRQTHYQTELV